MSAEGFANGLHEFINSLAFHPDFNRLEFKVDDSSSLIVLFIRVGEGRYFYVGREIVLIIFFNDRIVCF